ncbi:transposase [Alloiococcus sp. CFN-8]|uniref:transposase n=1 Tax=Alloiococcus sp. CFN-8 TaxID=3416081 RepID=UPI003CF13CC0
MGRHAKIFFKGAIYHVYQRGNNRDFIFNSDLAKNYFLRQLMLYKRKFNYDILAYAIMDNHYHLLIQTHEFPLSKIMFTINNKVAKYIAWLENRSGHVYGERYNSVMVKDDRQLVSLLRYIHKNPIRAHLCASLNDYKWCSHKDYIIAYTASPISFVQTKLILDILSPMQSLSIERYKKLMNYKGDEDDLTKDMEAVKTIAADYLMENTIPLYNPIENSCTHPTLKTIYNSIYLSNSIKDSNKIISILPSATAYKIEFIKEAIKYGYTLVEIASFLSTTPNALCSFIRYHKVKSS